MSSYARYCRDQASECARRARLASSPEIAKNCQALELRWRRLAEKADSAGRRASSDEPPAEISAAARTKPFPILIRQARQWQKLLGALTAPPSGAASADS